MSIGAKASVTHQHIAGSKGGVELSSLREVIGTQGGTQHLQGQTGARMQEPHQVGDRKSTPRLLASRLAKVRLQLRGICHRET